MATKQKVTITLDRKKADEARALVGVRSTSEAIDRALDELIRAARLRKDVAAYRQRPPSDAEVKLAELADTTAFEDDTDWEALYAEGLD